MVELWDCILENTEWNKAGIENAISSRKHDEICRIDRLIHELEKIKHKMEIESQQLSPEKPAEKEQDTPPAKGEKEKTNIINIRQSFKSIFGGVQKVESVQTGDRASIHKQPTKGGFLKIAKRFLDWVLKLWPK